MRIVTLLPSATEMICALGLGDQLVGVSHECDFPPGVDALPAVTKTHIEHDRPSREIDAQVRTELSSKQALYALDDDLITQLEPELIVTQSLCDVCAVAEAEVAALACALPTAPAVFNMQPMNLSDVLETITSLGQAAGVTDAAASLKGELIRRIDSVRTRTASLSERARPRVVFLEWVDPPFNAGHWNPELIEIAGGRPLLGVTGEPSTTISFEQIEQCAPDAVIVGCCGFNVQRTLVDIDALARDPVWSRIPCVRDGQVHVVDGNAYFNRPGPRLIDSLELLAHTLHPNLHPLPPNLESAKALAPPL